MPADQALPPQALQTPYSEHQPSPPEQALIVEALLTARLHQTGWRSWRVGAR